MNVPRVFLSVSSLVLLSLAGCGTAPSSASDKADLQARSSSMLGRAKESDPTLAQRLREVPGYAVFPKIGKGAAGVGGAYGRGLLYENDQLIGYCDMVQGSVGAQLGGKSYAEIVVFESQRSLDDFKNGQFTLDANASAIAVKSGAAANANSMDGVTVFTMDDSGLMFEAALGGQKFSYEPA